jgi:Zn-dependent M28 family amino/carboxypeptidase
MRFPLFVLPFSLACLAPVSAVGVDDPAAAAVDAVRPRALEAHVRFLADDLLEGRGTGTRGHEIAARYVAAHFASLGLEPAGDAGTFFQSVPLKQSESLPGTGVLELRRRGRAVPLVSGTDFIPWPNLLRETADVSGPVVYLGFGVSAPELHHDDYAGVDMKGKIAAIVAGAPSSFPSDARAYYSSLQLKKELAAAHGAVAALYFGTPEEEKRLPFARLAERAGVPVMAWVNDVGAPDGVPPGLVATAVLSPSGAKGLFEGAPSSLEATFEATRAGGPVSVPLPVEVRLAGSSRHASLTSPNVLGVLRGSDPELSKEYVVLSAHLDHLGLGPAKNGDAIYNGAYDNASGSAALLEIAQAFTRLPRRPRRSILFAAVTGEEKGLLGADYFANHPTVALEAIVANLNMDMFLTLYPLRDIVAFGAEHSSLGAIVGEMAARVGLELAPDPFPEEVIFIRSDHFPFVKKGIPAIMLSPGLKSADPAVSGGELLRSWISTRYHSPQDDMSQSMNFAESARIARLYLLIAERVAETPQRPTWATGDFFGRLFGH